MQTVTIRMDRVFDIQPDAFSGNFPRTLFSFESSGSRFLSVLVDGSPNLQSGQTITAVLTRPKDWQSVIGIRIHETGEIFAPKAAFYMWLVLLTTFGLIIAYAELQHRNPNALAPVLSIGSIVGFLFAYKAVVSLKIRRALRQAT